MNKFNVKRIIVAAVLVPLIIAYVYFLSPVFFLFLLLFVAALALREFYMMYRLPSYLYMPAVWVGGVLFFVAARYPERLLEGFFLSVFGILLLRLFMIKMPSGSVNDVGILCVGVLYIAVLLSFQWHIREDVDGLKFILLLYASVWIADSSAYYIGKYLGKKKLYLSISPNKTVEGAAGSIMGGAVGALAASRILDMQGLTTMSSLMTGGVLGFATMFGDLIESMFKRDAGIKDSSNLIPGHGGILDKIDGLLIAGPILYFIIMFIQ